MENLDQEKIKLKSKLPEEGISYVIKYLKGVLPPAAPKYDLLLQIESAYKDVKHQMLEGLIKQEDIGQHNAVIRRQLLDFIDDLEKDDFSKDAQKSRLTEDKKIRKGHVLYQIPAKMQLWEESRCLVRIAFTKEMLIEDLDLDENTEFKLDVRISDYMRVDIMDPAANPVFEIRSTSEPIQFIDEDDFTEWRFYVKPLVAGKHDLELKVFVIINKDGKELIREKTLEESVVIVAEPVVEEEPDFKESGEIFFTEDVPELSKQRFKGVAIPKQMKGATLIMLGLVAFSALSYAFLSTFSQEVDFSLAKNILRTEEGYDWFINKYEDKFPESKRIERAYFEKVMVNGEVLALKAYLEENPRSPYREKVTWELAELSNDPIDYLNYLAEFPKGEKADQARKILQEKEELILEQINPRNDETSAILNLYLRVFPHKKEDSRVKSKLREIETSSDEENSSGEPEDEKDSTEKSKPKDSTPIVEPVEGDAEQETKKSELNNENDPRNPSEDASLPADRNEDQDEEDRSEIGPATENDEENKNSDTKLTTDPVPEEKIIEEISGMTFIKGGSFSMGDQFGDGDNEEYLHNVSLSDFYMGISEVTFDEFDAFCLATEKGIPDDSGFGRGARPVINISWFDAVEYCNWRSEQEGRIPVYQINGKNVSADWTANGYRLPTEAEWEYAARSKGKNFKWSGTSQEVELGTFANIKGKKDGYRYSSVIRSFKPNELGIYDMNGNVWEWCWDWYGAYYYKDSNNSTNPKGPVNGTSRVYRGGSWLNTADECRNAFRENGVPGGKDGHIGFRLALSSL